MARELGNTSMRSGSLGYAVEKGRLLVIGVLGGGIVHEFANLLTVVDGLRQMGEMGLAGTWRPDLVARPAARCQEVVHAFRWAFSDEDDVSTAADEAAHWISTLIALRLRGRRTVFDGRGIGEHLGPLGAQAPQIRIAILCALLALLDPLRGETPDPEVLTLTAARDGSLCRLLLQGRAWPASRGNATEAALWEATEEILRGVDGTIRRSAPGPQLEVELRFPIRP